MRFYLMCIVTKRDSDLTIYGGVVGAIKHISIKLIDKDNSNLY